MAQEQIPALDDIIIDKFAVGAGFSDEERKFSETQTTRVITRFAQEERLFSDTVFRDIVLGVIQEERNMIDSNTRRFVSRFAQEERTMNDTVSRDISRFTQEERKFHDVVTRLINRLGQEERKYSDRLIKRILSRFAEETRDVSFTGQVLLARLDYDGYLSDVEFLLRSKHLWAHESYAPFIIQIIQRGQQQFRDLDEDGPQF